MTATAATGSNQRRAGFWRAFLATLTLGALCCAAAHALAPKPRTPLARAERAVFVLPNDAPTLWNGAKALRGLRAPTPAWATAALDDPGPLSIAAALDAPARVVPLRPHRPLSPYGFAATDGLVDLAAYAAAPEEIETGSTLLIDAPALDRRVHPDVADALALDLPIRPWGAPVPTRRPTLTPEMIATLRAEEPIETSTLPADAPQITIVVTAVGLNEEASAAALEALPKEIALAIAPVAKTPERWITAGKDAARVMLVEAPMETASRRTALPDALTLSTEADAAANLERLERVLELAPGVDGVATYLGDRFTADGDALRPVLDAIRDKELMFLETTPGPLSRVREIGEEVGLPVASSMVSLDRGGRTDDLSEGLALLEAEARRNGRAIGVAVAIPSSVTALQEWTRAAAERGFRIVPLEL